MIAPSRGLSNWTELPCPRVQYSAGRRLSNRRPDWLAWVRGCRPDSTLRPDWSTIDSQMKSSVVIFANPIAGRGRAMAISEDLQKHLSRSFHVEHFSLPASSVDLDRIRALGPLHAVISIGGDGTLQGVSELVLKASKLPLPPILIIPLGTANLIAKHLKLPWRQSRDIERIGHALKARKIVTLDACRCNGKIFLAVAGVGFDAQVVHELHRRRRGPITKGSYVLPTMDTFRAYQYPQLSVNVDGRPVFAESPALVYVGNVREYGTGIPMLPDAQSNDDVLDVCILPCKSRQQAIKWMLKAATGMHIRSEGAVYVRGRKVLIDGPSPVPIQLDGEAAGHTPAVIELMDFRLPFIVE